MKTASRKNSRRKSPKKSSNKTNSKELSKDAKNYIKDMEKTMVDLHKKLKSGKDINVSETFKVSLQLLKKKSEVEGKMTNQEKEHFHNVLLKKRNEIKKKLSPLD